MKKLMLTAVFALGTLTAIQAQETEVSPTEVEATVEKEDGKMLAKVEAKLQAFKEIKVSELPTAVSEALSKDFATSKVEKAYVNDKNEYKLVLQSAADDGKVASKTVFATKNGEWIKKPKAEIKQ
jgi:hypothetical protein